MSRHNFKKQFGQNFLKHGRFASKLIAPLNITEKDFVIEIGPGDGSVTAKLLNTNAEVLAIEVDYDLLANLLSKFQDFDNLHLVHEDFLVTDLSELVLKYNPENKPIKIVSSLPYNISKQIIKKLFDFHVDSEFEIDSMSFIIQNEVAKSYASNAPQQTFLGALSNLFAQVKKLESIPASQFIPRPGVDGGIIFFRMKPKEKIIENINDVIKFIKIGFSSPRKKLIGNLKNSNKYQVDFLKIFEELEMNPNARAAELSNEDWLKLYKSIYKPRTEVQVVGAT